MARLRWSTTCRSKGFTLLEVLVGLALLSIICGALYGTYFALVRGDESARQGMQLRRETAMTLDLLRRELAAVSWNRDDKLTRFAVEDRDSFGKPASVLTFTTVTTPSLGTGPVSDQLAVKFRVASKDNRLSLMREAKEPHLLADPVPYPQLEELEGFLVECYDGRNWVKSWDTTLNQSLPKAVRVTIRLMMDGKPVEFQAISSPRGGGP